MTTTIVKPKLASKLQYILYWTEDDIIFTQRMFEGENDRQAKILAKEMINKNDSIVSWRLERITGEKLGYGKFPCKRVGTAIVRDKQVKLK